ncbi:MAG: apolipoprotein N-acyltransferase, partial [Minisyncoccia bacterium]
EQRVIYATVDLRTGDTWYVSVGDGPFIWLFGLVFAASVLLSRRSLRSAAGQPGSP